MFERLRKHIEGMRPIRRQEQRGIAGIFWITLLLVYGTIHIIFNFSMTIGIIVVSVLFVIQIFFIHFLSKVGRKETDEFDDEEM